MSEIIDSPGPVRAGEELPHETLSAYLAGVFGKSAPLAVEQFRGGHSNLTYLLRHGEKEVILRRPPVGSNVATAHDMSREYRVLTALWDEYGKVPRPLDYCDDESVIGSSFYLMERLRGVVLRRTPPPGLELDESTCDKLCANLVETLAELHNLDYKDIGLGDLGRPAGYIERQVTGWSKRYEKSKTDEIAAADQVASWLAANQPASDRASLIHNDFKFDNLVLDPDTLEVIGILDWEMSTVGDPWMDLGTSLCYWVEKGDPAPMVALAFAPTSRPGMWTRKRVIERYEELTSRAVENPLFFYAFGCFKLAVVVQQIYYRFVQGLTQDKRFQALGQAAEVLMTHAAQCIDRESF